jgi:hypothetical protein
MLVLLSHFTTHLGAIILRKALVLDMAQKIGNKKLAESPGPGKYE